MTPGFAGAAGGREAKTRLIVIWNLRQWDVGTPPPVKLLKLHGGVKILAIPYKAERLHSRVLAEIYHEHQSNAEVVVSSTAALFA